jgi:hypothetical protein
MLCMGSLAVRLIRDGCVYQAEPRGPQSAWIRRVSALLTVVAVCAVLCGFIVWPLSENPAKHDFKNYPDKVANLSDTPNNELESSDLNDALASRSG